MKRLFYPLALTAILAIHACNSSSSEGTARDDTTSSPTDTSMSGEATDQQPTAVDTVFANKAAISGMAEVELGQLALKNGTNAQIKEFASMMVDDHGKANDELKTIATSKMIALPTALDAEHGQIKSELMKKKGAEFDRAYAKAMIEGHRKTLALMEDGAKNNEDPQLRAFAAKTAPVVEHHLEMITDIQKNL